MSITTIITTSLSMLFFMISFGLSIRSNLFLDALFRSSTVFIGSFIFIYILISLFKQLNRANEAKTKESLNSSNTLSSPSESFKGEHIDFKTPDDDDDSEFKPLQPRKINKQDD
jgi:hypothetical protein